MYGTLFVQPIGFVIFLIAAVAELNRTPFDLPEAESELLQVTIRNTQVSLGVFHAFRVCIFLCDGIFNYSTIFRRMESSYVLGFIPGAVWFALKFSSVVFLLIWFRVTFPRIRGDQLMEFGMESIITNRICKYFLNGID